MVAFLIRRTFGMIIVLLAVSFVYFAVVTSGGGEWEEVPQGISEASRRATKTRSKIPEETGAELEGKFVRNELVSPSRQVLRHSGHSDRLGKKVL